MIREARQKQRELLNGEIRLLESIGRGLWIVELSNVNVSVSRQNDTPGCSLFNGSDGTNMTF